MLQSEQLDQPLARDMIYTSGHMLSDNSVMQSFDLGADGYMYCSQVGRGSNNYNVIIVRKQANAANYESRMLLPYAGHGNNIAVEQDGADMYVWVGSYGTRSSEGDYTLSQTMARIKYAPGKTLKPSECYEQYWIPQRRNLQASLDPDNDIILFWCTNSNYSTRYIYLYRLSEVKGAARKLRAALLLDHLGRRDRRSGLRDRKADRHGQESLATRTAGHDHPAAKQPAHCRVQRQPGPRP